LGDKQAVCIEPKEEKPDIPVEDGDETSSTPTNIEGDGEEGEKKDEASATPEPKDESSKESSEEEKQNSVDDVTESTDKESDEPEIANEEVKDDAKVSFFY
jgi:hypothetical protein